MEEVRAEHLCSLADLLLQEKAATSTDICTDFRVHVKPLNPSHAKSHCRAEQLSVSGAARISSPVPLTPSSAVISAVIDNTLEQLGE